MEEKHFVIYHNVEKMGEPECFPNKIFAAYSESTKINGEWEDGIVWIIVGRGRPKQYYLLNHFKINRVLIPWKNFNSKLRTIIGREKEGKWYTPPILLSDKNWCKEFVQHANKFQWPCELTNKNLIHHLKNLK